jgi:hypothetical protein
MLGPIYRAPDSARLEITKIDADPSQDFIALRVAGVPRSIAMYSRIWKFFVSRSNSGLAGRIIFLNLAALLALLIGVLHVARFRAVLIDTRVQSLLLQGEIIAGAIAASAATESEAVTVDPQRLLELRPGESYDPTPASLPGRDLSIDPERAAPLLRRLVAPTKLRARLYDRDGRLNLDSRNFYDVLRFDVPPTAAEKPGLLMQAAAVLRDWFTRDDLPLYRELGPQEGKGYEEVDNALSGYKSAMVRINDRGEVAVSVGVPVQQSLAVGGALMLTTQGPDLDDMAAAERLAVFKVFLIVGGVMVVLSFLLAGAMAGSVRRLTLLIASLLFSQSVFDAKAAERGFQELAAWVVKEGTPNLAMDIRIAKALDIPAESNLSVWRITYLESTNRYSFEVTSINGARELVMSDRVSTNETLIWRVSAADNVVRMAVIRNGTIAAVPPGRFAAKCQESTECRATKKYFTNYLADPADAVR